jgi:Uncharacterized protein conserved in bacteria
VKALFVRTLSITIVIHDARSLKDKRQILQSLMQKVRQKFNTAIAEVGYQDEWQRAEVGLAFLSNQISHLEQIQPEILNFIEDQYPVEITGLEVNDY